jgi:hypothetical protein
LRESDQLISQHERLAHEIYNRQLYALTTVETAKNLKEIREGLKHCPITYAEFKEKSGFELRQTFGRLRAQIDISEEGTPKDNLDDYIVGKQALRGKSPGRYQSLIDCIYPDDRQFTYEVLGLSPLALLFVETGPVTLSEQELPELKDYAKDLSDQEKGASGQIDLVPSCTLSTLMARIRVGHAAHIARALPR